MKTLQRIRPQRETCPALLSGQGGRCPTSKTEPKTHLGLAQEPPCLTCTLSQGRVGRACLTPSLNCLAQAASQGPDFLRAKSCTLGAVLCSTVGLSRSCCLSTAMIVSASKWMGTGSGVKVEQGTLEGTRGCCTHGILPLQVSTAQEHTCIILKPLKRT